MYSLQPYTLQWQTQFTTTKLIALQATATILFLYTCLADQCLQLWNYTATDGTMISTQVKKICKEVAVSSAKSAQILGAWSCRNLNFVWWHLIFSA